MTRFFKKMLRPYLYLRFHAFFRCIYRNKCNKFLLINFGIKSQNSYVHIIGFNFLIQNYFLCLSYTISKNYDINCVCRLNIIN